MFSIVRTNSDNKDFRSLVHLLDQFLADRDGEDHAFYDQYNKLDQIKNTVVCYKENVAVGCGAFKKYDAETVEIKRMFVSSEYRGKGAASLILQELETWAKENNFNAAILETVKYQAEAIALYNKNGYSLIPNFGQYKNMVKSVCMHKIL